MYAPERYDVRKHAKETIYIYVVPSIALEASTSNFMVHNNVSKMPLNRPNRSPQSKYINGKTTMLPTAKRLRLSEQLSSGSSQCFFSFFYIRRFVDLSLRFYRCRRFAIHNCFYLCSKAIIL